MSRCSNISGELYFANNQNFTEAKKLLKPWVNNTHAAEESNFIFHDILIDFTKEDPTKLSLVNPRPKIEMQGITTNSGSILINNLIWSASFGYCINLIMTSEQFSGSVYLPEFGYDDSVIGFQRWYCADLDDYGERNIPGFKRISQVLDDDIPDYYEFQRLVDEHLHDSVLKFYETDDRNSAEFKQFRKNFLLSLS